MTLHPACVVAYVLLVFWVGVGAWLVRRADDRTTAALRLAAEFQEQAALAKAQLEQATHARRTLPTVIRSVARSYAAKAKN